MNPAEIEEKDFEGPLYNQLLSGHRNFATPGQVFEGKIGIDAALEVLDVKFWSVLLGKSYIPKGVILDDYNWGYIWKKKGKTRKLPNFSLNLLIQAKRPDVLKGSNSNLSPFGITKRYWRFKVTEHQQKLLEKVSHKLSNKCLVIYASPAFDTFEDLYTYTETGKIVDNTNFVRVENLINHKCWNYNSSGTSGVANTEYEFIEGMPFFEQIEKLIEAYVDNETPFDSLNNLYKSVLITCEELSATNGMAWYYLKLHEKLKKASLENTTQEIPLLPFLGFQLFVNLMGLQWFCIGKT